MAERWGKWMSGCQSASGARPEKILRVATCTKCANGPPLQYMRPQIVLIIMNRRQPSTPELMPKIRSQSRVVRCRGAMLIFPELKSAEFACSGNTMPGLFSSANSQISLFNVQTSRLRPGYYITGVPVESRQCGDILKIIYQYRN